MENLKLKTKKDDYDAREIIKRNGFVIKKEMAGCVQVYHRNGKKYRFDGWESLGVGMNPEQMKKNPRYITMKQV